MERIVKCRVNPRGDDRVTSQRRFESGHRYGAIPVPPSIFLRVVISRCKDCDRPDSRTAEY